MTSQQLADRLLAMWQAQASMGIMPAFRHLPANDNDADAFERTLEAIRLVMERTQ